MGNLSITLTFLEFAYMQPGVILYSSNSTSSSSNSDLCILVFRVSIVISLSFSKVGLPSGLSITRF